MSIPGGLALHAVGPVESVQPAVNLAHALRVTLVREPDAGESHVLLDERGVETEHGWDAEAPAIERVGNR